MQILVINSKGGCGKTTLVLALADMLQADIIEHDVQRTIANSATLTGRHRPVRLEQVTRKHIIHDMPPYRISSSKSMLLAVDHILIPCKMAMADLLAVKTIIDELKVLGLQRRSTIVFNEVRKPHNNTYTKVKNYFKQMYKGVKKAKTELSNLVAFRNIFEDPIHGLAKVQMTHLLEELNILYE